MKKFLTAMACVLAMTGCQKDSSPADRLSQVTTPPISGLEITGMNTDVRAQDDFFAYANGKWLAETEIPADKASWGSFDILNEKNLEQLRAIVQEAATETEKSPAVTRIGNFYNAFMDEARIEAQGLTPVAAELSAIDALSNHVDVAAFFGTSNKIGLDAPLNFFIDQDARDSSRYIVYLTQSGLGLPDRDYYFDDSKHGKEVLAKYRAFITRLLELSGTADAGTAAARVLALETRLAKPQWTKVANRDDEKTYNKLTGQELATLLSNLDSYAYMARLGMGMQDQVIVRQPSYAEAFNRLFTQVDLQTWKDYLRFKVLTTYATVLPKAYDNASFSFYGQTLNGQIEQRPRWKRAIAAINGNMGELLGQLYVAKYFPPEAKARMVELVQNLIAAYGESIRDLDWMGETTQQKALEKLGTFTLKIGYPDRWRDYSSLEIAADDLVGNIKRASIFDHQWQIGKLGKPVDRSEWFMPPQTINAYYNPGMNEIVFPAGILQPPFFNMVADDAVNYGAIGGIIGHEIGHGFDDQGSKYTGKGNLENWWGAEDRERFEAKTRNLVAQYNAYQPLPGHHVNGELTLGENIGDLGGLSIAYKAYRRSLSGVAAPIIDGFSGEQRVFLGWAQGWRVKNRKERTEQLLKVDPHSPPEFRVNGVMPNIEGFYQAFEVKPEHRMHLPPEKRVTIW
ncbi:MAG: M13 family metallopeptidase [Porticoccaceae bacterium]